ncbi:MAG: hypothetical protein AAB425_01200, partial [Bdellovibrionota bacterium]
MQDFLNITLPAVIRKFPKGSIWQTRYICFPVALVAASLAFSHSSIAPLVRIAWFTLGLAAWTLLEYILHRWVLHYQPISEAGRALLERLHITHHEVPNDQTQVCIPTYLAFIGWGLLFLAFV